MEEINLSNQQLTEIPKWVFDNPKVEDKMSVKIFDTRLIFFNKQHQTSKPET